MELTAEARREQVLNELSTATSPMSASALANKYSVSRQIIVGDVAILRAAGHDIMATPRGYIYEDGDTPEYKYIEMIACNHTAEQMQDELYTIVDNGAAAIDVTVEHVVYGQISGNLNLSSRFDVNEFIKQFEAADDIVPISVLTQGMHLHRIGANSPEIIDRVRNALKEKGLLIV